MYRLTLGTNSSVNMKLKKDAKGAGLAKRDEQDTKWTYANKEGNNTVCDGEIETAQEENERQGGITIKK